MNIGIVGYPGDLLSPGDAAYGEHMYEMYMPTEFDLASSNKLLQYEIDTFGGNSGSPVIVKDDMKVIGVHVLGGAINSASVIGPLGNVFETYKGSFQVKPDPAFDISSKVPSRVKSFRVVTIPSKNKRGLKPVTKKTGAESSFITNSDRIESAAQKPANDFPALISLLESSVHPHANPDQFLGELHQLLEPAMVNAMSDACNGAEDLLTALRFLWDTKKGTTSNNESLVATLAKHKSTAKHIGKAVIDNRSTIEEVSEHAPIFRVLKYGVDAATEIESANNEGLLEHIATGLSVTAPLVDRELPKLGTIGRPVATVAASMLRSAGAQAVATLNSAVNPSDAAQESELAPESVLQGIGERAVLAETALHGVMRSSQTTHRAPKD